MEFSTGITIYTKYQAEKSLNEKIEEVEKLRKELKQCLVSSDKQVR